MPDSHSNPLENFTMHNCTIILTDFLGGNPYNEYRFENNWRNRLTVQREYKLQKVDVWSALDKTLLAHENIATASLHVEALPSSWYVSVTLYNDAPVTLQSGAILGLVTPQSCLSHTQLTLQFRYSSRCIITATVTIPSSDNWQIWSTATE